MTEEIRFSITIEAESDFAWFMARVREQLPKTGISEEGKELNQYELAKLIYNLASRINNADTRAERSACCAQVAAAAYLIAKQL